MLKEDNNVVMIDVSTIRVVNSRTRSKHIHAELVDNIKKIGLKKPITVRETDDPSDGYLYDLICGQGRLEAFILLDETKIPAIIKNVDKECGHIMSLAENIARRRPRSTELFNNIMTLKSKGFSDAEIGAKIGCSRNWVSSIISLKENGEDKLLSAVETGKIPIYLAVEISRVKGDDLQNVLLDGFNSGELNPKQLSVIKKILAQRTTSGKSSNNNAFVQGVKKKKLTPEELRSLYEDNVQKHKMLHTRSEFTMSSLLIVKEVMTTLLQNADFVDILMEQDVNSVPAFIIENSTPERGLNND
ncbi:TPA: ParB N-terminal domain-containing protein [Klebsiella aerogenes]|nr:ParB N-terminal domain-containing protein [Klebsiella aerogenes]